MLKENNYILKISLIWFMLYIAISNFTLAAFPIKAIIVTLITLLHIHSENMIKDIIYTEGSVFIIAVMLKSTIFSISGEWLLGISFVIYILYIYLYGKFKIYLKKSAKF